MRLIDADAYKAHIMKVEELNGSNLKRVNI